MLCLWALQAALQWFLSRTSVQYVVYVKYLRILTHWKKTNHYSISMLLPGWLIDICWHLEWLMYTSEIEIPCTLLVEKKTRYTWCAPWNGYFYKINIAISFVKANQRMLNIGQAKDHVVLHQPYWEPCASLIVAFSILQRKQCFLLQWGSTIKDHLAKLLQLISSEMHPSLWARYGDNYWLYTIKSWEGGTRKNESLNVL